MNPRLAAAMATILWGFTYIVSSNMLPHHPVFIGAVRALGGGIPLLLFARTLLPREWIWKIIVLGTLNAGLFFGLIFVAALRLPGGVAATIQALGPLFTILLAWPLMHVIPSGHKIFSVLLGALGVSLVVLRGSVEMDMIGVLAGLGAALSVALGGIYVHKWGRPCSLIAFTGWQLVIGGIELAIFAVIFQDIPASLSLINVTGFVILALFLTALAFALWFRGIEGAGPSAVAPFFLLAPVTAFVMDAVFNDMVPGWLQLGGIVLVLGSLLYGQLADRRAIRAASRSHVIAADNT
ncbi:MAG: DMT family transporter [Brucellaceae bacterium]|jgi:probable blue pigment (indigoidine) exporter|nr:DMT family transporter [Brucellaceae bacterium]